MATQALANQFANNPVNFLKTKIVRWAGAGPATQQVIQVAMQDEALAGAAGAGRRRVRGLGVKVDASKYLLRHAVPGSMQVGPGDPRFTAVWSGYEGGRGYTATLPAAGGPNVMLTPELTGCTVVCRPNPDGSADFSHYNISDQGSNQTVDRGTMEAIAQAEYGGGQTTFTKEQYRAAGIHGTAVRVTVVGFRRNGRWEFWGQIREDKASGQQLREVRRLA